MIEAAKQEQPQQLKDLAATVLMIVTALAKQYNDEE